MITPSARVWAAVLGVASVLPLPTPGSCAQAGQSPLVEPFSVEFFASGDAGAPIADLRIEEVRFELDGRERRIVDLRWVPNFDPRRPDGRPVLPLPLPFGTNSDRDGTRTVLIVVDDYSFRPGQEHLLRQVLERFLASLAPRDQVAVVTLPYGGLKTDLTTEHERALSALSHVFGQAPQGETGSDLACRTRRTLESLTGLLESLRGGEGPTTVLFFSSRLAGPRRDAFATLAPGMCELTVDSFRRAGAAASSSRSIFYIIQPDDVMLQRGANQTETISGSGFLGSDNPLEGLEHLAGVTGGRRLHLQTPDDAALERVSRETAGYYALSFDVDPSDREGVRRQVNLRVSRPGATIRVRPQFTIPRTEAGSNRPTPTTMLRDGRIFRGLPLRALGYASRNADDNGMKVVTIVEPLDAAARLASVAVALVDESGRVTSHWTASDPDARPLLGALTAAEGTYRLRVAATDASGRGGTVDYPIHVDLAQAGPLSISGLVLGVSRGGFTPRLSFGAEPAALAYLEIYGNPGDAPLSVAFELATTVNGAAIVTTPGVIEATRAADRFAVTAAVPIAGLPPGDYLVRAVVNVVGHASGRVMRTLRITPK